jgi:hypothetical protein
MESGGEDERNDSEQNVRGRLNSQRVDEAHASDFDSQTLARRANDLVRLALFSEHKRVPLKREDITKKGASFLLL